jgi:hypothetical protein
MELILLLFGMMSSEMILMVGEEDANISGLSNVIMDLEDSETKIIHEFI